MDDPGNSLYFPAMTQAAPPIPSWQLYGESSPFPDLLHVERIVDRAAGLDWRIAPHRHLHLHQVFLIETGDVRLSIDGARLRPTLPLLLNLPRGTVHGFEFTAGTEGYVLTLPAADFPEILGGGAETAAVLSRPFHAPGHGFGADFEGIARTYGVQHPYRRLLLRAAAVALACGVAGAAGPAAGPALGTDPRIARFEALVRSSPGSGMRLADYAAALALSERHLRRLCLAATGQSAHAFIESIRLREACRLLAYTRMRVQDVGFALGYDDPAYFSRAFQRGLGLSPGAYRARLDGL